MIKLTRVERHILANQYRILEKLTPEEARRYGALREIVEYGFEAEYEAVFHATSDDCETLTERDCDYVKRVLAMYSALQYSFSKGQTAGVDPNKVKFPGFDTSRQEVKFAGYAAFLRQQENTIWASLELDCDEKSFNSHLPKAAKFELMLAEWEASKDKHAPTASDIVRILQASKRRATTAAVH